MIIKADLHQWENDQAPLLNANLISLAFSPSQPGGPNLTFPWRSIKGAITLGTDFCQQKQQK